MTEASLRIQFVSDRESIDAISEAAAADSVVTEPHEIPVSDQRFGIAEVAAIIAIVHTSAKIAELLCKAYKALRGQKKITVRTPKGSVTIEGDGSTPVELILKQIEDAGIL
jgi:hypothetical protein